MEDPVPFTDVRRQHAELAPLLQDALAAFLVHGSARDVEAARFEEEFASLCETDHCAGVASGTTALKLALTAAGIGPGDEVILPSLAGVAPAMAVIHCGATPVLCDVRADTGLIDVRSAGKVVGSRTAAVIAIHLYGQPCDMHGLAAFAQRHQLLLVEETSRAIGARFSGARVGSLGDVAAFGFGPGANLASLGSGGAVCTDDALVAERVRRLRDLGREHMGEHVEIGFDEGLNGLEASFLRVKLDWLESKNAARGGWAELYRKTLPATAAPPWEDPRCESVYGAYPVRVASRGRLRNELRRRGVRTGIHHWPPLHAQPALAGRWVQRTDLPATEDWSQEELCLPVFPELTGDEVTRVTETLSTLLGREREVGAPTRGPHGGSRDPT